MRKIKKIFAGFLLLAVCMGTAGTDWIGGALSTAWAAESIHEFQNFTYARDYLKQQMIKREQKITFILQSQEPAGKKLMAELMASATATDRETKGREGDYLDIHIQQKGYQVNSVPVYVKGSESEIAYYEQRMTFRINYYTTWDQERELTYRISQVLSDLHLSDLDTYEKIQAIYTYVCKNVSYDLTGDDGKFTAYNALVEKKAVCQGYAALMYRLLRDAGIECRIIKGTASGVAHSWNIVKIGTKFYNLDATWDAGSDPEDYKWFLKTDAEFKNHTREEQYLTADFQRAYPMASETYCFGNHVWSTEYTVDLEPTCSSYGLKSIHCIKCGEIKEGSLVEIPKTAHKYGKWKVTTPATVFKAGVKTRTCSVCGAQQTAVVKKLTPKVTLNASSIQLKVGQKTGALKVDAMGSGDSVRKWTTSDKNVVTVNSKTGKMTARKKGRAVITVTLKSGVKASCQVRVGTSTVRAKAIAFEKKKMTVKAGEVLELKLIKTPLTAVDKITYVVSKNNVLTIENGVIRAKKAGTAYVKAATKSGLTAKCRVTVKK